jgi:hypothetical protein
MSNGFVRFEIEYGERPISAAEQESSAALSIERHPVIVFAPGHRIAANYAIGGGVDNSDLIHAAQIDEDLAANRVILRRAGLAVETQRLDDGILVNI